MCSVVILVRPGHDWPVLLAANRDEMIDRPWRAPGRHWPEQPDVVGGLDELAGGSWLGLSDGGLAAGVLNRMNTLGPAAGMASRGGLVLKALEHADAAGAAEALGRLDPARYRPFNMVIADARDAFWLRHLGPEEGKARIEVMALPPVVSIVTAHDRNDLSSPRIRRFLPRFEAAAPPDPTAGDWSSWTRLLESRDHAPEEGPGAAMTVVMEGGFGTVSGSLIGLPRQRAQKAVWLFAAGRPGEVPYLPVAL